MENQNNCSERLGISLLQKILRVQRMQRALSTEIGTSIPKPEPVSLSSCLSELKLKFKQEKFQVFEFQNPTPMLLYSIQSHQQCNDFLNSIFEHTGWGMHNSIQVIGLDTETCTKRSLKFPALRTYPSTIQIAFGEGLVGLVHIYHICKVKKEPFPAILKRLLESNNILKSGVGVSKDVSHFREHFRVDVNGTVDIDAMAKSLRLPRHSLSALAYLYTGALMDKQKKLIFSPWDSLQLKDRAIAYAGYDALYSREVYFRMLSRPALEITAEALDLVLKPKKV
jgi:hypothetical protein